MRAVVPATVEWDVNADAGHASESLYGLCRERNWAVQEIRVESLTLEDAFLKVTGHEQLK